MISEIRFRNFKQFKEFRIQCRKDNIFAGPNNCGKSTTLDAPRVCADVLRYARRRNPILRSMEDSEVCASHEIEHRLISIPIVNTSRNYNEEDSEITIRHSNGNSLHIFLNREKPVRVFLKSDSVPPRSATQFNKLFPLNIIVVPTLKAYPVVPGFAGIG